MFFRTAQKSQHLLLSKHDAYCDRLDEQEALNRCLTNSGVQLGEVSPKRKRKRKPDPPDLEDPPEDSDLVYEDPPYDDGSEGSGSTAIM